MTDKRSRRAVLQASAVAATGLAGCTTGRTEPSNGHLFVTNPTAETKQALLTVVESPEGESRSLVDATYWVPPRKNLRFRDLLEAGEKYAIEANRPGGGPADTVDVTVETCDPDDPSERLDVRVRVEPDAIAVVPYGCDSTYTTSGAPYVTPAEYRVTDDAKTGTGE